MPKLKINDKVTEIKRDTGIFIIKHINKTSLLMVSIDGTSEVALPQNAVKKVRN